MVVVVVIEVAIVVVAVVVVVSVFVIVTLLVVVLVLLVVLVTLLVEVQGVAVEIVATRDGKAPWLLMPPPTPMRILSRASRAAPVPPWVREAPPEGVNVQFQAPESKL